MGSVAPDQSESIVLRFTRPSRAERLRLFGRNLVRPRTLLLLGLCTAPLIALATAFEGDLRWFALTLLVGGSGAVLSLGFLVALLRPVADRVIRFSAHGVTENGVDRTWCWIASYELGPDSLDIWLRPSKAMRSFRLEPAPLGVLAVRRDMVDAAQWARLTTLLREHVRKQ